MTPPARSCCPSLLFAKVPDLPRNIFQLFLGQMPLKNKLFSVFVADSKTFPWLQVPLHSTRLEIDASAESMDVRCDMSPHDLCTLLGFSKLLLAK